MAWECAAYSVNLTRLNETKKVLLLKSAIVTKLDDATKSRCYKSDLPPRKALEKLSKTCSLLVAVRNLHHATSPQQQKAAWVAAQRAKNSVASTTRRQFALQINFMSADVAGCVVVGTSLRKQHIVARGGAAGAAVAVGSGAAAADVEGISPVVSSGTPGTIETDGSENTNS